MRWVTFSRLVLAGRAAQEAGDNTILGKLGAELARIQACTAADDEGRPEGSSAVAAARSGVLAAG